MNAPIRVAMITQGYYPLLGGAERQLANVAPLLQSRGVDVQVITRRIHGLPGFELIQGVPVHRLPIPGLKPTRSVSFTVASIPLLSRLRPDVIHAYGLLSPATTALFARRLLGTPETPIVVKILRSGQLGDIERLRQKWFGGRRLGRFGRSVDAFIAISHDIDEELAQMGIPAVRRPFIPNGIDTDRYAPLPASARAAARDALGLSGGPIVVFTGRLAPEKRVSTLLDIWPSIRTDFPQATLLLLGTGPEEPALRRRAGAGVVFGGLVDSVLPFLQVADLFVLPSVAEGLSNALMEALSTGLAAVATNVGGASDLIEPGISGCLVPPDDRTSLEQAIRGLLGDPSRRAAYGARARQRILDGYSLAAVADQLRALYDELLARRRLSSTALVSSGGGASLPEL